MRDGAEARTAEAPRLDDGSLTPELKEELGSRHDSMRSCYQTLLGRNPKAQGKIVVALQIGERGEVSSTKVERDELGSATMVE